MLVDHKNKTITLILNDPEDDYSTGMLIRGGFFPKEIIVKQRQEDGSMKEVTYVEKE